FCVPGRLLSLFQHRSDQHHPGQCDSSIGACHRLCPEHPCHTCPGGCHLPHSDRLCCRFEIAADRGGQHRPWIHLDLGNRSGGRDVLVGGRPLSCPGHGLGAEPS